jgi:hypothetical protein
MGFLAPALLFLGIAISVPLILHLFQRQQGPRMVFPALRYLRRAEKENARRIRLRQFLLLALRVLALLILAAAAARPFIRTGGAGHVPTAVVFILDNSLSSGAVIGERRVLDVLKQRALETLEHSTADDRFWLIRAGAPWEPAFTGDAAAVAARVRETEVAGAAANLTAALARARSLLAAGAERRAAEIQLLSDLQESGLHAPLDAGPDPPALVVWSADDDVPRNAAIGAVQVGGGLPPRAGERSTVAATLIGAGTGDTVTARLAIEGRISGVARAPLGSATVLPFPARPAGIVTGYVEIDPDALRADDRRYFVADVEPPPAVALTQQVRFVSDALDVLADAGRVRRTSPADAQVLIAPAGAGLEALNRGRTVIVIGPESPLELPAINRRLAEGGVPWRFAPAMAGGEARFPRGAASDELSFALERAQLREFYALQKQGNTGRDTVLVKLQDGTPWLVRGEIASGARYLLVASPFTQQASSLATSSAMVPLLDHLVGAWSSALVPRSEAAPGQTVRLPAGADEIERPDGVRDRVTAGEQYRIGTQTGVYRVYARGRPVSAFAVNAPAAESELTRVSSRRLDALLPGWDVETADSAEEWLRDVFRRRLGSELWRALVILALLMLIVESLVASAGRQRAISTDGARAETDPDSGGDDSRTADPRTLGTASRR